MSAILRGSIALVLACGVVVAQEGKKQDDVLQLKTNNILVGSVVKIEADTVELVVKGETQTRKIAFRDIMPYSLYQLKFRRIDKASAAARFELGEFCMTLALYATAAREFEEAAKDAAFAERAGKRREEARREEARSKFEEAKKLHVQKNYDEAVKLLVQVTDRYSDTPYFEEAKKELAKITEEVKKEVEDKKAVVKKKEEDKAKADEQRKEDQEKFLHGKTLELVAEAEKSWLEGLDHEAKNLTKADKAWRAAEAALLIARRNLEQLLKSNDVEVLKKAKETEKLADQWLVKTYYRLGRMWAVELNYPFALEFLNKGMKVPHDEQMDRLVNEILLTISQLQMRRRASTGGTGY